MPNILNTLTPVSGISHPLVADMYLKKDFGSSNDRQEQDVLVIEARGCDFEDNETEHDAFDSYLIDLLLDLEGLKTQVEEKIGTFDRVDIRTA